MSFVQYTANIILQVTLIVLAITLFFFLYTSHIEEKIVITQIDNLVNSFTRDVSILMKSDEKQSIQKIMKNIEPPEDMSKSDQEAAETNQQLINKSIFIIGGFVIAGIFISILLCLYYQLDFQNMIKSAIFGVTACIFTEYMFLTYFAANYKSLDPNAIKKSVIISLNDYSNT